MNERILYQEKRFGWAVLGMAAVLLALIVAFLLLAPRNIILWSAASTVVFVTILTYGIHFGITSRAIVVSYGIGFFSEEVDFSVVKTVMIGQNESLKSWAYAPMSREVVVVTLRDDSRLYLPSRELRRVLELVRSGMESKR